MRQSYKNQILSDVSGINLGADYCAEHECGISGIQSAFGIDTSLFGLEKRKIQKPSDNLVWIEQKSKDKKKKLYQGLYLKQYAGAEIYISGSLGINDTYTQWGENGFAALSCDEENVKILRSLFNAFASCDVAIWLGGGGIFQNAGLAIAVASKLPADITSLWQKADEDNAKLKQEALATGIESRLKKAGRDFFALSPSRQKDGGLRFWLNPMSQHLYNAGYFSVADLDAWIEGKGPVVK